MRETTLARLLPLLLLALAALLIAAIARQQAPRPRSDRTYRPHADGWGAKRRPARTDSGSHWLWPRADLAGVRDAYSSAAIDPDQPLYGCGGCQALYHQASLQALRTDNRGRCVLCGSPDLRTVRVL